MRIVHPSSIANRILEAKAQAARDGKRIERVILTLGEWQDLRQELIAASTLRWLGLKLRLLGVKLQVE